MCNGQQTGSATASVIKGTLPYTFTWAKEGKMYSGNPLQKVEAGTYTLTVTDDAGCIASGSVTIDEPEPLNHIVNITNATCGNPNGNAMVNEYGGTAPYSFLWSPTGGISGTAAHLEPGNYIVNILDNNQCEDSVHIRYY